jgi:hypothetical protein
MTWPTTHVDSTYRRILILKKVIRRTKRLLCSLDEQLLIKALEGVCCLGSVRMKILNSLASDVDSCAKLSYFSPLHILLSRNLTSLTCSYQAWGVHVSRCSRLTRLT